MRASRMKVLFVMAAVALIGGACSSDGASTESGADTSATAPATTATEAPETTTTTSPTESPTESSAESSTTTVAGVGDECSARESGVVSSTIDAGGQTHALRVFVPSSYDGSPMALVMNWHGLGSDGPQQAQFSDYESLAETEGFVVAHPTGVPGPGSDQNSWELEQFDDPTRDDVAMAATMIDQLIADYCLDPSRVYSTGMSNGGFFTSRLVCELSDRIAAAVSVAGVTHPDDCTPGRAVPFMAFHGTADGVVPFDGGGSVLLEDDALPAAAEFFSQVMPDEFAEFAASSGCNLEPLSEAVSPTVTRYEWSGCDDGAELIFFEVDGGGHTWPGSPLGPFLTDVLGVTTNDVDATADGWAFMEQFRLP